MGKQHLQLLIVSNKTDHPEQIPMGWVSRRGEGLVIRISSLTILKADWVKGERIVKSVEKPR